MPPSPTYRTDTICAEIRGYFWQFLGPFVPPADRAVPAPEAGGGWGDPLRPWPRRAGGGAV